MKGVKVSDFSGRSLGVSDTTSIEVNPDLPEAHRLRGWYDTTGHASTFESYAKGGASGGNDTAVKTIGQIAEENMGMGEKVYLINSARLSLHNCHNRLCSQRERTILPSVCKWKRVQ